MFFFTDHCLFLVIVLAHCLAVDKVSHENCGRSLRFDFSSNTYAFISSQSSLIAAPYLTALECELGIQSVLSKEDNVVNCMNILNGFVKRIKVTAKIF